jgi:hypothetical protein
LKFLSPGQFLLLSPYAARGPSGQNGGHSTYRVTAQERRIPCRQ